MFSSNLSFGYLQRILHLTGLLKNNCNTFDIVYFEVKTTPHEDRVTDAYKFFARVHKIDTSIPARLKSILMTKKIFVQWRKIYKHMTCIVFRCFSCGIVLNKDGVTFDYTNKIKANKG